MLKKETQSLLKELKKNSYDFSNIDPLSLAYELLQDIGSKDSVIRDDLIYPVLAHLLHDDVIDDLELARIAKVLVSDEYLFYDMQNKTEYSVLTRSFTSLQLVILVYKHNEKSILSDEFFIEVVDSFIEYYKKETDYRGYVEGVGWLHSIAHSADMFTQIVQNESITEGKVIDIFEAIKSKFMIRDYMFNHEEDERSINALEKAIRLNKVNSNYVKSFITDMGSFEKGTVFPDAYNILRNVKCFLRSLYFRFLNDETYGYVAEEVQKVLLQIK